MPFQFLFDAPRSPHTIVVESDDRTVWAYLCLGEEIIGDVWLYNAQPAAVEIDARQADAELGRPPLNAARFVSAEPPPPISFADDLSLEWDYVNEKLNAVKIAAGGTLVARLEPGAKPGWSRFAAVDGPCALRLA